MPVLDLRVACLLTFLFAVVNFGQDVTIRITVMDDSGQPFKDLRAEDLNVVVNKRSIKLASLRQSREEPLKVMILVDASASQEQVLGHAKKTAELFIDHG